MPDKRARRPERKRLHNRTTRRHRAESPAIMRTTCEKRQPAATATASAPSRYRHLAARPVPALPSPSLIRHCTGILHRHDIIPVSCGQLREQHAFSLYRQRLAPPAHQTGISGVPSPLHPVFRHPAPPVPATKRTTPGKAQPSGKRRHSGETLRRQHATRPAFRHPPAKKPPVRCRNGRFFHGLRSAVPSSPLFQSR